MNLVPNVILKHFFHFNIFVVFVVCFVVFICSLLPLLVCHCSMNYASSAHMKSITSKIVVGRLSFLCVRSTATEFYHQTSSLYSRSSKKDIESYFLWSNSIQNGYECTTHNVRLYPVVMGFGLKILWTINIWTKQNCEETTRKKKLVGQLLFG